jgi:hypothetical protein
MYRRKKNRVKMVLAIRIAGRDISGNKFEVLTHTLDISLTGVRVGGMEKTLLEKGDVVEVQRKHRKAKFKVAWVGENGSQRTGHVGLQSVDAPREFWALDLPDQGELPATLPPQRSSEPRAKTG